MKDHLSVMSFHTSIQFRPTLQAQHDDATKKGQQHRADLFSRTPHQPQRQPSIMINLISITHIMPLTARSLSVTARRSMGRLDGWVRSTWHLMGRNGPFAKSCLRSPSWYDSRGSCPPSPASRTRRSGRDNDI